MPNCQLPNESETNYDNGVLHIFTIMLNMNKIDDNNLQCIV